MSGLTTGWNKLWQPVFTIGLIGFRAIWKHTFECVCVRAIPGHVKNRGKNATLNVGNARPQAGMPDWINRKKKKRAELWPSSFCFLAAISSSSARSPLPTWWTVSPQWWAKNKPLSYVRYFITATTKIINIHIYMHTYITHIQIHIYTPLVLCPLQGL